MYGTFLVINFVIFSPPLLSHLYSTKKLWNKYVNSV
nr:MAG TPA: hypothetical protein [Caudoviricetes sp.]